MAVVIANDEVGDVEPWLEAAPVRREPADRELGAQLVGNRGFDARPERVDARQHDVAQAQKHSARDEIEDECERGEHAQRPTQHDVVASAPMPDLRWGLRVGGFVSLGHAAAAGRMVVLRVNDEM
ncbi:hypothetical protein OKW31_002415 [Paraburkholderia atlantica]